MASSLCCLNWDWDSKGDGDGSKNDKSDLLPSANGNWLDRRRPGLIRIRKLQLVSVVFLEK